MTSKTLTTFTTTARVTENMTNNFYESDATVGGRPLVHFERDQVVRFLDAVVFAPYFPLKTVTHSLSSDKMEGPFPRIVYPKVSVIASRNDD